MSKYKDKNHLWLNLLEYFYVIIYIVNRGINYEWIWEIIRKPFQWDMERDKNNQIPEDVVRYTDIDMQIMMKM